MKLYNCEQRSEEWYYLRKGKMTASNGNTISVCGKGLETYCYSIIAEKYSNNKESYSNNDIERGIELEESARLTYEIETGNNVDLIGFIELNEFVGCSPDGLVVDDGGVEIKCPNDVNFIKLLINGEKQIDKDYLLQCQMSMLITKRKWWDLVFYNPNFSKNILIFRQFPILEEQEKLKKGIEKGIELLKEFDKKITNLI